MGDSRRPPQEQEAPGRTGDMKPKPNDEMRAYRGNKLLAGKVALITGGDSGIGRAVAVGFAKEGADVAIAYLNEHDDAEHTKSLVEKQGQRCITVAGDLVDPQHCGHVVAKTVETFGGLNILVNNIATQTPVDKPEDLTRQQWQHTFDVNIHSFHHVTSAALPYLESGSCIINTGSVNGLRGNNSLIDYAATKGAVHAWTYSMSQALLGRGIRVNCVAPGPVWTPLIPATFPAEKVEKFGTQAPAGREAQPDEIAPSYIFFAVDQFSSYYTGEILAPVGGEIVHG